MVEFETNFYITNPANRHGIVETTIAMKKTVKRQIMQHHGKGVDHLSRGAEKDYSSCLISSLPFLGLSARFSSSALRFLDAISASVRVSLTTGTP
jgi:hypothetical protein